MYNYIFNLMQSVCANSCVWCSVQIVYVGISTSSVALGLFKLVFPHRQEEEEFEDTKGAIIIRILKKNRQHNDQKKKYKRTNNHLQNIYIYN
jgi:hypothetical protein